MDRENSMASPDTDEKLVAVGKWLYDDTIECVVQIVQRNIAYGSGDYEDPVEIREDREGVFYYLKFFNPANPGRHSSEAGAFDSIELAKIDAKRTCSGIVWE